MTIRKLPLVKPGDPTFAIDSINFNTRRRVVPSSIVECRSAEDVRDALRAARSSRVPFRVRSGRHNYEAWCAEQDALLIDISGLKRVEIDAGAALARFGAGLTQQEVWSALAFDGRFMFPLGTMWSVGIAGVLQGGGIGMLTRAAGLSLDRVVEIELVTADARIVVANEKENSAALDLDPQGAPRVWSRETERFLPTQVAYGYVFAFFHDDPHAAPPPLPRIEALELREFPLQTVFSRVQTGSIQDAKENPVDLAHFYALHQGIIDGRNFFARARVEDFTAEGAALRFVLHVPIRWLAFRSEAKWRFHYQGPTVDEVFVEGPIATHFVALSTPIDESRYEFHQIVLNRKGPLPGLDWIIHKVAAHKNLRELDNDIAVWARRRQPKTPMFTENDRALVAYRSWAAQFYVGARATTRSSATRSAP